MPPRNVCSSLLHEFLLQRPRVSQLAHVVQAAGRPASLTRKLASQICGYLAYDLGAPALVALSVEDVATDRPVQPEHLGVRRADGAKLGAADPPLQICDEGRVAVGSIGNVDLGRHRPSV
nr:hypothetical protein GCM10025730_18470 [Promicromonospora thailandica]